MTLLWALAPSVRKGIITQYQSQPKFIYFLFHLNSKRTGKSVYNKYWSISLKVDVNRHKTVSSGKEDRRMGDDKTEQSKKKEG